MTVRLGVTCVNTIVPYDQWKINISRSNKILHVCVTLNGCVLQNGHLRYYSHRLSPVSAYRRCSGPIQEYRGGKLGLGSTYSPGPRLLPQK